MAIVDILQYPDPRLKRKGIIVTDFGDAFQRIVDDMIDTYHHAKNCAALAATQLDLHPAPHVTVINFMEQSGEALSVIVNGEIVARAGEQNEEEGCMSVGCDEDIFVHGHVKRDLRITLKAQDRYGKPIEMQLEGFLAKCVQHELDHLNGVIYLDYLSPLKRKMIEKKLAKEKRLRDKN